MNSFQWGDTTISVHELTIADEDAYLRSTTRGFLPPDALVNSATPFFKFMAYAKVEGKAPVPVVTERNSAEDWQASYAAWLKLPLGFLRQWVKIVEATENDPNG